MGNNIMKLAKENEVTMSMTERADELLHMILDMRMGKEVNLHQMQTTVLSMYRDSIIMSQMVDRLESELEVKKRTVIDLPAFITKKREAK